MFEYLKTAAQTAKKNGCTLINNKLVADFSAVKKLLNSRADELEKIGLTAEEVYSGFARAAVDEIQNIGFVFGDFIMIDFFAGKYRIYADFINYQKSIYADDKRKYGVLTTAAARININCNEGYYAGDTALYIEMNPHIYKLDIIVSDIYIA